MTTLFVSDLHLEPQWPEIGTQFEAFLEGEATRADAVYILGDLFESWIGDDDPEPYFAHIKRAMRKLSDRLVPVYFMHGNRDFMIGERFAADTGVAILPDPYALELYGTQVLLCHGDSLCTDDVEFQQVRATTRDPEWQRMILAKSVEERRAIALDVRTKSRERSAWLPEDIMDVNPDTVKSTIIEHGVEVLLHGHTHRPAVHDVELHDRTATRIVLGDWYQQGSVLRWNAQGYSLDTLPRP